MKRVLVVDNATNTAEAMFCKDDGSVQITLPSGKVANVQVPTTQQVINHAAARGNRSGTASVSTPHNSNASNFLHHHGTASGRFSGGGPPQSIPKGSNVKKTFMAGIDPANPNGSVSVMSHIENGVVIKQHTLTVDDIRKAHEIMNSRRAPNSRTFDERYMQSPIEKWYQDEELERKARQVMLFGSPKLFIP